MKMHSLSYETPDYGAEVATPGEDRPTKTAFPELRLRDAPKLPEGEFYVVAKVKKVGYRDPIDEGEDKSCDLAFIELAPVSEAKAKSLGGSGDEDAPEPQAPRRTLRESMGMKSDY